MPRMDVSSIHGDGVRTALRFVSGAELAGAFRAADLVVLPYREIDQSGVLFTALAFGKPLLLTSVGGFPEIAPPAPPSSCRRATRTRSRHALERAARRPGAARPDGRRLTRRRRRPVRLGRDRASARSRSTRGSRRRPRGRARPRPPGAGAQRRSPVSRNPVRSATRCDGWLSSWMSSSISSSPSSVAPQSRSSVTAREATPRPRAAAGHPVADLAVARAPGRAPSR